MNNLCVVARYHEDINWLKEVKCDHLIYNKGDDFPFEFDKIDIPNIGREAETYIRACAEFYDKFSHYDYVFFLQGHPFDSNHDIIDDINNFIPTDKIMPMSDLPRNFRNFKNDFAHGYDLAVINKLLGGNLFDNGDVYLEGAIKCHLLCYILKIHNTDAEWWCGNAQYAVHTSKILNKSLKWWRDTLKVAHFVEYNTPESLGHVCEFLWPKIFEYSDYLDDCLKGKFRGKI